MQIWRVCKRNHQATAFSGVGGLYTQSRWAPQGLPIVYTSESLALASLEVFVHTESDRIPLVAICAFLPSNTVIEEVEAKSLPANWQQADAYPVLQNIGKQWLQSHRTPVLKVPSAIIPVEFNYLINPQHPDLQLELEPPMTFRFDQRMWKPNRESALQL